jgi:PAS domain S-box-containing protein
VIPIRALVVEDSEGDAVLLALEMRRGDIDFSYLRVETAADMKAALESSAWDVVISDYSLPNFSGPAALRILKESRLDLPFMVVSGTIGEDVAVETMREGATDYLLKGNLTRLVPVVLREVEQARVRQAHQRVVAQAAEALQASELRYRRLFEAAKDGVLILDADSGEIVDVNPFLLKLIGFSHEEIVGRQLWEIGVFKDVVASKEAFRILREKEYVRYDHLPLQARDGRVVDVEFVSNVYEVGRTKVIQCNVRDITERRRADQALRASEARFRELVDQLPEMVFETDLTGRISFVNALASTTLGLSPEDLGHGLRIVDLVAPEFRDLAEADIRLLHAGAVVRPREIALSRKDGATVPVSIHPVLFHHEGVVAGIRGVAVDITERKVAESELRLRNLLLSTHLEVLKDGVLVVDSDGRVVLVNRRFGEILNAPAVLLVSSEDKPILQFVMEQMADPETFLSRVEYLYAHPEEKSETELLLKDGRTIARYSAPMVGSDGKNYGRVWNFRDVTEAKRAEAALMRSELYYRSLIEHGADIILVVSPDAIIQYASPAAGRLLERAAAELVGRSIFEFIHPEDQKLAQERLQRVIGPHTPEYVDVRVRNSDGSWRTLAAIGNVLPREIGSGIVINARDRTEHLHLESQMRQAQKMEAVGRLAGGIAHDFNNVLTAILGYGQLLADKVQGTPELAEDVAEVLKAGERAATLTRQLLTFSRQRPTEQRILALDSIVDDTEKMLRRLVGEDVVVTAKHGNAGLVKVDPGQIEQVLVNLAVNARDAMSKGGHLTIETSRAELDETYEATHLGVTPGEYVLLTVTDTGTGMNAATLGHLFEPFFTTKEQGKGTGLGLSTVYGIVKQSGGHIEVYSEPGLGTTFKIYLPEAEMEKEVRPASSGVHTRKRGSETILLVEDEEAVRLLVRRELESRGYTVLTPASTGEALLACDRHTGPIHLLLTDVVMPGMLGPEVARRACELRPDMKVLYMSGYTDESIIQRGLLQGNEVFIQKPFSAHALSQKVRDVLDGDSHPSAGSDSNAKVS